MHTLTLYTRSGCHLCEEAHEVLEALRGELGFGLDIVDIDTDPALRMAYGTEIPVVLIDGRKSFKYKVDPRVLRERLGMHLGMNSGREP